MTEMEYFRVYGQVILPNKDPVDGILVRAFDRDLRSLDALDETRSDTEGHYEIQYTKEDFRRAQKDSADLLIRAYNEVGSVVAESEIVYNADPEQTLDLQIKSVETLDPSEYERLETELGPILDGVSLTALSDEDIEFLARETALDKRREEYPAGGDSVRLLADAAALASETAIETEVLYALARNDIGTADAREAGDGDGDLASFLDRGTDVLRDALTDAIDANVVREDLRNSVDAELRRLRTVSAIHRAERRADWESREVTVRLRDESTGEPLAGYQVEVADPDIEDAVEPDTYVTDSTGTVRPSISMAPSDGKAEKMSQATNREFRVFDHRGDVFHRETVTIEDEVEITVSLPGPATDPETDREALGGESPPDDAHQLRHLVDSETGTLLADRGFATPKDIARAPRSEFRTAVQDALDPEEASDVHTEATIQTAGLDSLVINELTNTATRDILAGERETSCDPAESAVSQRAYLAALLEYVGSYVTAPETDENGEPTDEQRPLDPAVLTELFYQPFDGVLEHENATDPIRHVRICVESLLRHHGQDRLGAMFEDPDSEFHESLVQYWTDAYDELLRQWGTSRSELLAASHDEEKRAAVAERLGIEPERVKNAEPGEDVTLTAAADPGSPDAIAEANLERIFGLPAITRFTEGTLAIRDPLNDVDTPEVRAWRLDHLRETWAERDRPTDAYERGERPVVDPDVIGPDDFRDPNTDASDAFELWVRRREWVDQRLAQLRAALPDVDSIVDRMSDPLEYGDIETEGAWPDDTDTATLQALAAELAADDDRADEARERVRTDLHLSPDALVRVVELVDRQAASASRDEADTVTDKEWREWTSILVGAEKTHLVDVWIDEEPSLGDGDAEPGDHLDPRTFWESQREPDQGEWSSWIDTVHEDEERPYIDPDRLDRGDVPGVTTDRTPQRLLESRREQLDEFRESLETTYDDAVAAGDDRPFEAVLDAVYDAPPDSESFPTESWSELFDALETALDEDDPDAKALVETTLRFSREEFDLLASLLRRTASDFEGPSPSDTLLAGGFDGLTRAWKRRSAYPDWIDAERDAGITSYWRALKAKLPPWRASQRVRGEWQEALRARSQRPIVDPDHLRTAEYFVGSDTAATSLRNNRRSHLATVAESFDFAGDRADREAAFETALEETVGLSREALRGLALRRAREQGIGDRLDQLDLSPAAFSVLVGIDEKLVDETPINEDEWADVRSTLVDVHKRRSFGVWRREERAREVTLRPELFAIPDDGPHSVTRDDPMRWRVDAEDRRQWKRTLESRINQRDAIDVQIREATEAAETESLPPLRETLIDLVETDGDDPSFDDRAEWASDRLLIDVQAGTCTETTRIQQAIESLQTLVSALDLGRDDTGTVDIGLELDDEHFESHWKWLGSYAEWKSAMGVYLYPENVLLPTLRGQQTPQFERIANSLTDGRTLPTGDAAAAAKSYSEYFEALIGLKPKAACLAVDPTMEHAGRHDYLTFVFAESTVTDEVYYRSFDPSEIAPAAADDFWDSIPVLDPLEGDPSVVGAVTYEEEIYLFLQAVEKGESTVGYVRYDVESDNWDGFESVELPEIDSGEQKAVLGAEVVQAEGWSRPPEIVVQRSWTADSSDDTFNQTLHGAFDGSGAPPDPDEFRNVNVPVFEDSRQMPLEAAVRHGDHVYVLVYYWNEDTHRRRCLKYDPTESNVDTWRTYDVSRLRIDTDAITFVPGLDDIYIFDSRFGNIDTIQLGEDFDIKKGSHSYLNSSSQTTSHYVGCNNPVEDLAFESEPVRLACVLIRRGVWRRDPRAHPEDWTYNNYLQSMRLAREPSDSQRDFDTLLSGLGPILRGTSPDRFTFGVDSLEATDSLGSVNHSSRMMLEVHQQPVRRSNVPYVAEAFFHVPLLIARQLTQSGNFKTALEWFRTVYDYTRVDVDEAQIWHGLVQERESDTERNGSRLWRVVSGIDWLDDPMDPHAIAQDRSYAYTQFTIFSIAQCLLEHADEEFTRDTGESVVRARSLYGLTLDLFDALGTTLEPDEDDQPSLQIRTPRLGSERDEPNSAGLRSAADESIERENPTRSELHASLLADPNAVRSLWERGALDSESAVQPATDGGTLAASDQSARPTRRDERGEAIAGFDTLRVIPGFCVEPNPYLRSLRSHAAGNHDKIRRCRTIAGLEREQRPRDALSDVRDVVPTPGRSGQLSGPGTSLQPTNYRYDTLVARAKELADLARQIESEFLRTLERRDQEAFQLTQARQNIELARAGVRLQGTRLREARDAVDLTDLELERIELRVDHYSSLLQTEESELETEALDAMKNTAALFDNVAEEYKILTQANAQLMGFSAIPYVGSAAGFSLAGALQAEASRVSAEASAASMRVTKLLTEASYERRKQRWRHQQRLAEQDIRIGTQQLEVARDRVAVVEQERDIAELQTTHAEDIATFHETKFTNRELYQWMSGVLERVYRYFLQQATSMAKLAESQLAFERQEPTPGIVGSGYWDADRSNQIARPENDASDRRGLTGSARLLQDIYQLDQHEFTTDERKLQIEKTISLAKFDPIALQRFRETGVLRFGTPMGLFDRDHPGHYLRLIKRVHAAVIALTPPTDGVKATLNASGVSRVVVGDQVFRKRAIHRQPESIVLRASQRGENVVDLQPESREKLRPFENMGVETSWELRMPKAANRFDYDSIADVLVAVEYTALDSYDYRQQVVAELDARDSRDRAFSFEDEFADQWYDLHNPDQTAAPMTVHFKTEREMFPPNLMGLEIEGVQLYFFGVESELEDLDVSLTFTEQGSSGSVGGAATPIDGVIRTPTASSWNAFKGKTPTGEWTLSLPDTPAVRELFDEDYLENILFVVTVSGELPHWPE